ncbi:MULTISPECIES: hypothetical protein [unclassified Streptomyces]|uniref:hypothetical protein n=1 Tax=unclassified Streptomyces TaxID=2593676 RepID=UPI00224D384F|nr:MULTISPECIES: hypothetical protein [unclassified Streptomyces]MCX4550645.1 hypothetical protein [Streptomyces sp. NBC_01500]WSC22089.1 hypothetical protein OIE60_21675 [Streptomyces sp. NBC_01766]WSV55937.1 hypothetical protein OG282_20770 [Streptomyces sp. NBC_01014]
MLDTTSLTAAVERFADRLRAAPQSRLQRGAAADGLALARELSSRAQRLEAQRRQGAGAAVRVMPDAGIFAVADQLAVAGNDLALELRTASSVELDEAVKLVEAAEAGSGL